MKEIFIIVLLEERNDTVRTDRNLSGGRNLFQKYAGRTENPLHHPEISTGNYHPSERLSSGLFRDRMQRRSPGNQ